MYWKVKCLDLWFWQAICTFYDCGGDYHGYKFPKTFKASIYNNGDVFYHDFFNIQRSRSR